MRNHTAAPGINTKHAAPALYQAKPSATAMSEALKKALGVDSEYHVTHQAGINEKLEKALSLVAEIQGTTYLAVDQSNIFAGGLQYGGLVDWSAVKTQLGGDYLASAAIVVSQAPTRRPQQDAFYAYLARDGWLVYRHLAIKNSDASVSENEGWVDGDVRKLIRAAADSGDCESIVVMSGDGGMTNAVRYARSRGKKVYVIAWAGTLHPALAAAATAHATIEDLLPLIGRILH